MILSQFCIPNFLDNQPEIYGITLVILEAIRAGVGLGLGPRLTVTYSPTRDTGSDPCWGVGLGLGPRLTVPLLRNSPISWSPVRR